MKNNNDINLEMNHIADVKERKVEKNDVPKSQTEIKETAKTFFHNFAKQYCRQEKKANEAEKEELFLQEVRYLDANTSLNPEVIPKEAYLNLSKEELQQLEENDPGYVNEKVLDYDNVLGKKENTYKVTGLHNTESIYWGDYATKEGVEYITLDSGKVVSRWGEETGTFLSDVDVEYDSLELPIIKEKNTQRLYEVLKSFPVEVSKVAKQPWNKENGVEEMQSTIQYKTAIPIQSLVKEGYLKQICNSDK